MDEMQLMGYAVSIVITLGAFIGVINKFTQPINELKIVIQKLNDNIDSLKADNATQTKRIDKHSDEIENHTHQIGELDKRVGKMETKMDFYHKGGE